MACKHAALAAIYAKQMAEMDEPWKLWRFRPVGEDKWRINDNHFMWLKDFEYELIPKTILINGIEVPEPMREKPEWNSGYYFISTETEPGWDCARWTDSAMDRFRLNNGRCHDTRENCIIHAKALFSFSEVK